MISSQLVAFIDYGKVWAIVGIRLSDWAASNGWGWLDWIRIAAFDLLVYHLVEAAIDIGKVATWRHFTGSPTKAIIHTNGVLVLVMIVNIGHILRIYCRLSIALLILHVVIAHVVLTLRLSAMIAEKSTVQRIESFSPSD